MSTPAEGSTTSPLPSALIGRGGEMERLKAGLEATREGRGGCWLLLGPGGMGKTRLLRWLEREALSRGFRVSWANGLQESVAPFFVFEQVFRRRALSSLESSAGPSSIQGAALRELGAYVLFEEEKPRQFRASLGALPPDTALLLVTRENPASLKDRLPSGTRTLWITRMEGEGRVAPGDLDSLGEQAARHLRENPAGAVAIDGIEYLTSQTSFSAVLKLLQFLRDLAQEAGGRLLVAINPAAFDRREVSLLESDAEVERPGKPTEGGRPPSDTGWERSSETPAATLLRYLQMLEDSAREGPQLIVLDDLHWADPQSASAFQFLVRNARGLPVLIVAGAREDEIPVSSDESGLAMTERLEALGKEGLLERMPLHGFGPEEARALASEVLGSALDPTDGRTQLVEILRRTEGNPYFLRETFLQLREEGRLRKEGAALHFTRSLDGADGLLSRVPATLRRMVLQRIGHLSPSERAFLETAAVAGSEFDLPPVAHVRHMTASQAQQLLSELVHRRRLLENSIDAPGVRWMFSHPLVWEVTVGEMPEPRRREHASALLDWWEDHRTEDLEALARLGHGSGDVERGLPWVRRALDRTLSSMSPESAGTYLRWMRELRRGSSRAADPSLLSEEIAGARRLIRAGGPRHAREALLEICTEGLSDELRWEATVALARATEPTDTPESQRITEVLSEEFDRRGSAVPALIRNSLRMHKAYLLMQKGEIQAAWDEMKGLRSASRQEMDDEAWGVAHLHGAWCLVMLGRGEEAMELINEALPNIGEQDGLLAQAYNVLGMIAESRNDSAGRDEADGRAAVYARRAGNLLSASIFEFNLAGGLIEDKKFEEAEGVARRLLDVGHKFDLPRVRCCGNYLMAKIDLGKESWPSAIQWATKALEDAELMQRKDDILECRFLLCEIQGESGDLRTALAGVEKLEQEGFLVTTIQDVVFRVVKVRFLDRTGAREACRTDALRVLNSARLLGNHVIEAEMVATLQRLGFSVPPAGKPAGIAEGAPKGL